MPGHEHQRPHRWDEGVRQHRLPEGRRPRGRRMRGDVLWPPLGQDTSHGVGGQADQHVPQRPAHVDQLPGGIGALQRLIVEDAVGSHDDEEAAGEQA